ncbi:MAG: transcriptional regulator NrdR [Gammaproteobacteria bacterium]
MRCPFCQHNETKVTDSRFAGEGDQVRRRRECLDCGERFTTYEKAELILPWIVKRSGDRVPFSEDNLREGILKSLEKRPVTAEQFEDMINALRHRLRACGEREISSQLLGEWVMEALCPLDEVAYVRFASVYRRFQDVHAFHQEIQRLKEQQES